MLSKANDIHMYVFSLNPFWQMICELNLLQSKFKDKKKRFYKIPPIMANNQLFCASYLYKGSEFSEMCGIQSVV